MKIINLFTMNLQFNARDVDPTLREKMYKKDIPNSHEAIVLKQFYERLARKNSKNIKPSLFYQPNHHTDESSVESKPKEYQFGDEKIHENAIILPNLQTLQNKSFKEKIIMNESIYIHERLPSTNEPNTSKKHSLQEGRKAALEEKRSQQLISLSSKQITDMEVVDLRTAKDKSAFDMFSPRKSFLRHKSNERLGRKLNSEIILYPIDEKKSPIKLEVTKMTMDRNQFREVFRQKSRIEKIIDHYKATKQKREVNDILHMDNLAKSIESKEKIKVQGEQTIYCEKDQKRIKRTTSISIVHKPKYINWKIKELPFTDITKSEVTRLFSMYLFLKEAVPAQSGHYKVYVGEGNNGQLVARLLKNRGWWLPTEDANEANLIWTQLPQEQHMKRVPSHDQFILSTNPKDYLLLPDNEPRDTHKIDRFLKHKHNPFFNACQKLLYPPVYSKFMLEFISKFTDNFNVKYLSALKDYASKFYPTGKELLKVDSKNLTVVNHCQNSSQIGDKKQLLFHIEKYCHINGIAKRDMIPLTVHLSQTDIEKIKQNNRESANEECLGELGQGMFILKPGQESNRGNGITVHPNIQALLQHISQSLVSFPENKTYVVQEYIDPLLYQGRKFDIRVWALYCGNRVWFYREGYVRTSCKEYTTKNMSKYVHLTNDAVQKYCEDYGKYEPANKLSFNDLDKYLQKNNYSYFYSEIYPTIKTLTTRLFEVGNLFMGRSCQQFQLFGLDFLIDKNYKVWLIECNTNPSLEICCSLLNRLVPNMLDNLLTIAVDPLFPAVERKAVREDYEWSPEKFNFELLLDGVLDTKYLETLKNSDIEYFKWLASINDHKLQPEKNDYSIHQTC